MQFFRIKIIVLLVYFQAPITANLYKTISQINTAAMDNNQSKENKDALNSLMSHDKQFHEIVYDKLNEQLNLSASAKRQAVFSLLSSYEEKHPLGYNTCLDQKTW